MSIEKIQPALQTKFTESRIVFWYDDSKEFEEQLPTLSIENVKVINLQKTGPFEAKYSIEIV